MVRNLWTESESDTDILRAFVRTEFLRAMMWYMLFDACWYSVSGSLYHSHKPPDIFSDTIPMQILFTWILALASYYAWLCNTPLLQHSRSALACPSPKTGHLSCGRLRDVLTVRDLWGKFWHQLLRRVGCPSCG